MDDLGSRSGNGPPLGGFAAPSRVTVSTVRDDRALHGAKRFLRGVFAGFFPHRLDGNPTTVSMFLGGNRQ
jgi:hypothetical protein